MGLFKKTMSAEEILKAIESLTDEEKKKVYDGAFGEETEEAEETDKSETAVTEESAEETEEPATDPTKKADEAPTDGAGVAEEPESADDEDDEKEKDDDVDDEDHHDDVVAALTARLQALEERVAKFAEIVADITSVTQNDAPLGVSGQANVGDSEDDTSEDDRIMRKYNPNWRRG